MHSHQQHSHQHQHQHQNKIIYRRSRDPKTRAIKHIFAWNSIQIPSEAFQELVAYFYGAGFGRFDNARVGAQVRQINAKHHCDISIKQAFSIHNLTLKEKIMKSHERMNTNIAKYTSEYNSGKDILAIAGAADLAPATLLRGILLAKGYSATQLYNLWAHKEPAQHVLKGRDLQQFRAAMREDAASTFNQVDIDRAAATAERRFVDWLRDFGIDLVTQDELVAIQRARYGRAISTPDVLFRDTVIINGKVIKWIDFKDYFGCNIKFIYGSNREQAERYNKQFGDGALCYALGHVAGLMIANTMLLDWSFHDK